MYAQAAVKPNTLLRNGAYGIVMRGVQKCTRGCSSLRGRKRLPLCCIKLDTATDPCMGSGHILCYVFDLLIEIYEECGYSHHEAVENIVTKNLWGVDLDERATQLAYFSVMMKARQYDRRFFNRKIQPNIFSICESNRVDQALVDYFVGDDPAVASQIHGIIEQLYDASIYGSILEVKGIDFNILYKRFKELEEDDSLFGYSTISELLPLVKVAEVLSNHYSCVITNPPYMNASYIPEKLKGYISENYPDFKNDLFAVFSKRIIEMTANGGYIGLLMPYVWMFIASYEKMRKWIYDRVNIDSLVQLEYNAFEAACVPVASLTLCKTQKRYRGEYIKLSDFKGSENQGPKTREAVINRNCGYRYTALQDDFKVIPGMPVAYWVGPKILDAFRNHNLGKVYISGGRNKTHNNEKYLRLWWEVSDRQRWQPYDKGGDFRRWYGNYDYYVDWSQEAKDSYASHGGLYNQKFAGKIGISWTNITSYKTAFRVKPADHHYDSCAPVIYNSNFTLNKYVFGLLNSNIASFCFEFLNPTIHVQARDVLNLPYIYDGKYEQRINEIVDQNIRIVKEDWDSFERSIDFKRHPLLRIKGKIEDSFAIWEKECSERVAVLRNNEEELNRLFNNIYGLEGEIDTTITEQEISVSRADLLRDIKSLISYAVGCMVGRFSLDVDGLVNEGQPLDANAYISFIPDADGIIPICDDEYFEDDIVNRFSDFIEAAFGKSSLEDNLKFIAKVLGGKGTPKEIIRKYFINDFFKDHCSGYSITGSGRRPIYWLFDSGKNNGFKCIVYIHRYKPDTVARIRTDYVHEIQARYRTIKESLESKINNTSTGERVKVNKELEKIRSQAEEVRKFEEKIHHLADQMISLDVNAGVRANYEVLRDVLAKLP